MRLGNGFVQSVVAYFTISWLVIQGCIFYENEGLQMNKVNYLLLTVLINLPACSYKNKYLKKIHEQNFLLFSFVFEFSIHVCNALCECLP